MILRIPRRAETQWLRVKIALREMLLKKGQEVSDYEIHSAAIALLEVALKCGPGIIADESSAMYEAPPPLPPVPAEALKIMERMEGLADRLEKVLGDAEAANE